MVSTTLFNPVITFAGKAERIATIVIAGEGQGSAEYISPQIRIVNPSVAGGASIGDPFYLPAWGPYAVVVDYIQYPESGPVDEILAGYFHSQSGSWDGPVWFEHEYVVWENGEPLEGSEWTEVIDTYGFYIAMFGIFVDRIIEQYGLDEEGNPIPDFEIEVDVYARWNIQTVNRAWDWSGQEYNIPYGISAAELWYQAGLADNNTMQWFDVRHETDRPWKPWYTELGYVPQVSNFGQGFSLYRGWSGKQEDWTIQHEFVLSPSSVETWVLVKKLIINAETLELK